MIPRIQSLVVGAALLIASTISVDAFVTISPTKRYDSSCNAISVPGMWGRAGNFGKGDFAFYRSFDNFFKPFAPEDRAAYPEIFNMPKGVYEVSMTKPLGIVFEEVEAGKGVFVQDLVEGGLAERMGKVQVGWASLCEINMLFFNMSRKYILDTSSKRLQDRHRVCCGVQ